MLRECNGKFRFDYVLADSWYSWNENMNCCKKRVESNDFIMALKSNRKVALSIRKIKQSKEYIKY